MSSNGNELNSELESFRQKWLSDLKTRNEHPETAETSAAAAGPSSRRPHHGPPISSLPHKPAAAPTDDAEDDYVQSRSFDHDEHVSAPAPQEAHHDRKGKKLVSALDHFEEAMHKEDQGNMGDSLKLYRKAYRVCTTIRLLTHGDADSVYSLIMVLIGDIVRSTSLKKKLHDQFRQQLPKHPLQQVRQRHRYNPSSQRK